MICRPELIVADYRAMSDFEVGKVPVRPHIVVNAGRRFTTNIRRCLRGE